MARRGVTLDGYEDMMRDLKTAEKNIRLGMNKKIRQAAEPVKATAETLAVSRIRGVNLGEPWSRMRVGVTQKSVYVAPRRRGSKAGTAKRPNFADLLMTRSMEPALEAHQDEVVRDIDQLIGREAARFNRG